MYRHTQRGTITTIATLAGVLLVALVLIVVRINISLWLLVVIGLLGTVAFSSMTVTVDHERLAFWFGPGWIRQSIPLADIRSWTVVTNPWWYGWGIHHTPHGWLYNVGGNGAIQLELRNGRRMRIGSDEPERLSTAITMMKGAS